MRWCRGDDVLVGSGVLRGREIEDPFSWLTKETACLLATEKNQGNRGLVEVDDDDGGRGSF